MNRAGMRRFCISFMCGMFIVGGCSRDPLMGDFDRPLTAGYTRLHIQHRPRARRRANGMDAHAGFSHGSTSSCLRCWDVLHACDVQNGTTPGMRGKAFCVGIESDLDGVPQNPGGIMVLNVVSVAAGHFDSERPKGFFIHSLLELVSCEHIAISVWCFLAFVKSQQFVQGPVSRKNFSPERSVTSTEFRPWV